MPARDACADGQPSTLCPCLASTLLPTHPAAPRPLLAPAPAAGTPLQNDLAELQNLLHFLLPTVFAAQGFEDLAEMLQVGVGVYRGGCVKSWVTGVSTRLLLPARLPPFSYPIAHTAASPHLHLPYPPPPPRRATTPRWPS